MKSTIKNGPRTTRRRVLQELSEQRMFAERVCLDELICAMALDEYTLMQIPDQWVSPQFH